jgi:hypothetical protein
MEVAGGGGEGGSIHHVRGECGGRVSSRGATRRRPREMH